jgi:hypothetical protein
MIRLSDYYALAGLAVDHEKLQKREKSVASAIAEMSKDGIRLFEIASFFLLPNTTENGPQWFFKSIYDEDSAFSIVSGTLDARLLALYTLTVQSAQIEQLRAKKGYGLCLCALMLLKHSIGGKLDTRPIAPPILELVSQVAAEAARALEKEAVRIRTRSPLNLKQFQIPDLGPVDANMAARAQTALKGLWDNVAGSIRDQQRQYAADREESDVLWWLQTNYSKRIGRVLSAAEEGAPFLFAEDLSNLVLLPPTRSFCYVLVKALGKAGDKTLKVEQCKAESPIAADSSLASKFPALFPTIALVSNGPSFVCAPEKVGLKNSAQLKGSEWASWHLGQCVLLRAAREYVND